MSNKYDELKKQHSKEFNEFPIFFAFDNEQFKKGMKELGLSEKDEDKIGSIGFGGFIRKTDVEAFNEMNKRHRQEEKEAIQNDKTGEGYIKDMFLSEMANHEYGYTYDITDTLEACGLSFEDIENNENLKNGLNLAKEEYFKREKELESEEEEESI